MNAARRWILAVETSNPSAAGADVGVALGERIGARVRIAGVEALKARQEGQTRGGLDDDLMPSVDRLFARCGASPGELERVCVSAGPGGYTGLRVACAVGKMIAEASGCGCVAVRSAHAALVATIGTERVEGRVAVLLASKQGSSWCEVFDAGAGAVKAGLVGEAGVIERAGVGVLKDKGVRTLIGDQFVDAGIVSAARGAGMEVRAVRFDAPSVVMIGAAMETVDPALLNPIYPREPDAVTLWRARHGGVP